MGVSFTNAAEFHTALERFEDCVEDELLADLKALSARILAGVIKRTPVKTGRAASDWRVGDIPNDVSEPAAALATGLARLAAMTRPFQQVTIENHVEYINYLEGGSATRAPAAMVSTTLAEAAAFIAARG